MGLIPALWIFLKMTSLIRIGPQQADALSQEPFTMAVASASAP